MNTDVGCSHNWGSWDSDVFLASSIEALLDTPLTLEEYRLRQTVLRLLQNLGGCRSLSRSTQLQVESTER